jgi:hypothetical protein
MTNGRPSRICLYDGVAQAWFSVAAIKEFLVHWLPGVKVEFRDDPLVLFPGEGGCRACRDIAIAELSARLCRMRVFDPAHEVGQRSHDALKPEMDYESRLLLGMGRAAPSIAYDGDELQRIALRLLPRTERGTDTFHVWFTERLIATWDQDDRRYHARVSVYGTPSIVSTSGMMQAPARERGYYVARRLGLGSGPALAEAPDGSLGREDPRLTEIAKGYAMQAVFYGLTGEPFCDDPRCRLFNAHWQREMLAAQLREGEEFCPRHLEQLAAWRTTFAHKEVLSTS